MCKQCMVDGYVFTLSGDESVLVLGDRRLYPREVKKFSTGDKMVVARAVEALAGLAYSGSVLKTMYQEVLK